MLTIGTSPTLAPTVDTKVPARKSGVPFGPPNPRQKNRRIHRQVERNNLRSRNSHHWFRLQDSVALQTCLVFSANCKPLPSKRPPNRCRGGEPACQRSNSTGLSHKRGLFPSSIPGPQKGWNLPASNRLEFPEQIRMENTWKTFLV